jgi:hypothetical protein
MPMGRIQVRDDFSKAFGQSAAVSSSHFAGISCALDSNDKIKKKKKNSKRIKN